MNRRDFCAVLPLLIASCGGSMESPNDFPPFVPIGQEQFPAKDFIGQYREDTWIPILTFGAPGNLNVVYTLRFGTYTKFGKLVFAVFTVMPSTFTHTIAAGDLIVSVLCF